MIAVALVLIALDSLLLYCTLLVETESNVLFQKPLVVVLANSDWDFQTEKGRDDKL